jgi:hypothetical protein
MRARLDRGQTRRRFLRALQIEDRDPRALLGEERGGGEPETARRCATGDDGGLSLEQHASSRLPVPSGRFTFGQAGACWSKIRPI